MHKPHRQLLAVYACCQVLLFNICKKDFDCRLAPVTQIISTAAVGIKYAQQLHFCMMLQTIAFVAFNKVFVHVERESIAQQWQQCCVSCCAQIALITMLDLPQMQNLHAVASFAP